ncbi:MAG: S41 family peptidase [Rhizobiaceae bacterium]
MIAKAKPHFKARYFNPETKPRFWRTFPKSKRADLFRVTESILLENGFASLEKTEAWMLKFCRSQSYGYLRILELEGIGKKKLGRALESIGGEFNSLKGMIIDIRDNPGGDDDIVLKIVNRFCHKKQVAFRRQTKLGPEENELSAIKTWHMKPRGNAQFRGPVVLLTNDSVFSGGEIFALAMMQLPNVTIIGDHTNGILSYQLERKLANGWKCHLSYQIYYSPDMECYEGKGIPPDIPMLNSKADLTSRVDPLVLTALKVLDTQLAETTPST